MTALIERSQQIILEHQAPSGGYVASPNFDTYAYCWYRDGSFIAYAMDRYGHHDSAQRFHQWAAQAVTKRAQVVERAVAQAQKGEPLAEDDILHTRYRLDGSAGDDDWPNFQLDGFGAWLWALAEHARLSGRPLAPELLAGAELAAGYLEALWDRSCYDCWEEFPDHVHGYTLAAIHGGLRSFAELTGRARPQCLQAIKRRLDERLRASDAYAKYEGAKAVDASLLGLHTPFEVVEPDAAAMRATVARIEAELNHRGGVHRYRGDSYYGGGQWLLLSAWLGWHYARQGEAERAAELLAWVEQQADGNGYLPEQVPHHLLAPEKLETWRQRWGPSASPLLWSHAKYLILAHALSD